MNRVARCSVNKLQFRYNKLHGSKIHYEYTVQLGTIRTFQEKSECFYVFSDMFVEIFTGPNWINENGDDDTGRGSNNNGGNPLVNQL